MDVYEEAKALKDKYVRRLEVIDLEDYQLEAIDRRLLLYISRIRQEPEMHNLYEICSVLKFLDLMRKYTFRASKVRKFSRLYEMLKFSGMDGRRCYKLTPVQYFQFASILGFYKWEDVGDAEGKPDKEGRFKRILNGRKQELRRLVREAILFVPRKFSKTTSTASLAVNEILFGDSNAQAYTGANSSRQAKICFNEIRSIARQLDPGGTNFKATRELLRWKNNPFGKESFVECLTGGGGNKDGLNASLFIYDEYAQARYVKEHSDGAELMQVMTSSMGVRREPLTVIITTASRIPDGPFALELENAKKVLLGEYEDDTQFASLFMPDEWEMDEEHLGSPDVWRKCNPHIGITVQESYYDQRWNKAKRDAEALIEFKTKMLNIFVSGGVKTWISGQLVRGISKKIRLDEIKGKPETMVGIDLSISDDLSAVAYNVYNRQEKRFYVFLECYIPEETLQEHPNRELYKAWIRDGFLKVCPGAVVNMNMITEDILRRNNNLMILNVGYDAYKAQETINGLKAAVRMRGGNPDNVVRAVPQTYGAFTSPVETLELAAKSRPNRVIFEWNPIIPYCFENCYLDEDRMGNKKPIKRKENQKIDGAIAILETFWLYNNYER